MAWAWCDSFYPYTLSKYPSKTPSNTLLSGSLTKSNLTRGNTPIDNLITNTQRNVTWDVVTGLKLNYKIEGSGSSTKITISILINNSQLSYFTYYSGNSATFYFGFAYDDSSQEANMYVFAEFTGSNTIYNWAFANTSGQLSDGYLNSAGRRTLYPYIKAAMDVQPPDWHAVNSVSGELGTFEFSKIAQEHINGGNAVTTTDGAYIERLISQTEITQIIKNIPVGTSKNYIYSGAHPPYQPGNYLKIANDGGTPQQVELIFYNAGVAFQSVILSLVTGHKYYLSFLIDRNNHYGALSIIDYVTNPLGISYNQSSLGMNPSNAMYVWLLESDDSVTPEVNKNDPGKGSDPWGTPDDIDPLTTPTISAIDTGFTSMFQVTKDQLQNLSDFLWSAAFLDNVKKLFSDPREIIVGIAIMPVAPEVGSDMIIQAGGISTGIYGKPLTSQYKLLEDIGSVYIQAENGNFLDYPPYTKITVHLPFCGEHSLDVNDVMGKTLKLSYLFDFLSGSVVAAIKVDGSTNYFFGGSCGMQVPSSSEDFGRMYSSILSAGATLGSALATVATGGLTAPLAIGAGAAMAANGMQMSPDVQHTSGSGSINGMLGNQSAYITVEKPNAKLAEDQKDFVGNMALITEYIKNVKGFIKCYKYHLDGVTATLDERKEIESYLSNGFRRETGSTLPSVTPVTTGNSTIIFMKCTSENDVMGKTWNNTTLKLEGKIIYNQSVLSPEFVINGDVTGYNYAYIDLFKRYYYISNITVNEKGMMTVSFKVDVLQSFKAEIDECRVIMERSTDLEASMMNDPQYWTLQNKDVYPYYFKQANGSNVVFSRNNNVFILTIAGSNARTP